MADKTKTVMFEVQIGMPDGFSGDQRLSEARVKSALENAFPEHEIKIRKGRGGDSFELADWWAAYDATMGAG